MRKRIGLLELLQDAFDVPVAVKVGDTLVEISGARLIEDRVVLELDPEDMDVAAEHIVVESATAARARAAAEPVRSEGT
ncbi:hypothetical protein [Actinoplanes sp. NPDC051851]|uniref:hypothetical protein n=1 Tax=Actinoplanes sp. NPDC051851 TaxID=3154753 RepID=UPI00343FCE4C